MRLPPHLIHVAPSVREKMLLKHAVESDEAEEALLSAREVERVASKTAGERRYLARGQPADGRRLNVVFADAGGGEVRIVTAYEPTGRKQRHRHRRD